MRQFGYSSWHTALSKLTPPKKQRVVQQMLVRSRQRLICPVSFVWFDTFALVAKVTAISWSKVIDIRVNVEVYTRPMTCYSAWNPLLSSRVCPGWLHPKKNAVSYSQVQQKYCQFLSVSSVSCRNLVWQRPVHFLLGQGWKQQNRYLAGRLLLIGKFLFLFL